MNLRLSETNADNGDYETTFACQRRRDETGILQVEEAAGDITARVYGRASEEAPWSLIGARHGRDQTVAEDLTTTGFLSEVPIFPLMRIKVVAAGGTGANTFKVWFIE
jgi:hypothetical protein